MFIGADESESAMGIGLWQGIHDVGFFLQCMSLKVIVNGTTHFLFRKSIWSLFGVWLSKAPAPIMDLQYQHSVGAC